MSIGTDELIVNFKDGAAVDAWLTSLMDRLHPPICPLCNGPDSPPRRQWLHPQCAAFLPWQESACRQCALPLEGESESGLCGACIRRPPPFATSFTPFTYARPISDWVQALKFERRLAFARVLAGLMANFLVKTGAPQPDALVPVPLHRGRLGRRGFNQSLELARYLGRTLGLLVDHRLIRRVRGTREQSGLSAPARRRNIKGAFTVQARSLPGHVALVDDVMTTGTTVSECARVLQRAGVERVDIWAVARAVKG